MDTNKRTIAKALCWQTLGLIVMTLIGYLFTGSASEGGALALTGAVTGFATYFLHEKLWAQVNWGRTRPW
jgi:uncharacterized membrane protein